MAKIQITESDIYKLVAESVKRIINENYGTSKGGKTWEPFYDSNINAEYSTEELDNLVENGVIPEELAGEFYIEASADCTIYPQTYDNPGYDVTGESNFGGDYNKAQQCISQIKDEEIKSTFLNALESFCEDIELEDFEEYEPDWDSMPGGPDYYE